MTGVVPLETAAAADRHARGSVAAAYAQRLDEIGAATRDSRFFIAAGILRGKPPGRRPLPDDERIAEVIWLVETQAAATVAEASRMVASTMPGNHSVESTAERLARKATTELDKRLGVASDTP